MPGLGAVASPWALCVLRRALDMTVAGIALVVFLPLMLLAAILVRFGSEGPVFFRQRRMGRNGRDFILYKFRSMCPKKGNNSSITVTGDARITPVGALLRRYKLDELPQFWNVLRGDMSLVGPRPKLPHHEALLLPCRPGITGVATLAFRREEEFLSEIPEDQLETFYETFVKPAKAQLDLEYMRTATLVSDLKVLWRTASACLFPADDALAESAETILQYETEARKHSLKLAVPLSQLIQTSHVYPAGLNPEL
jgi:lipopolysaccharide/colanic/teichoic acid biosynthesis glycosyltransferase